MRNSIRSSANGGPNIFISKPSRIHAGILDKLKINYNPLHQIHQYSPIFHRIFGCDENSPRSYKTRILYFYRNPLRSNIQIKFITAFYIDLHIRFIYKCLDVA